MSGWIPASVRGIALKKVLQPGRVFPILNSYDNSGNHTSCGGFPGPDLYRFIATRQRGRHRRRVWRLQPNGVRLHRRCAFPGQTDGRGRHLVYAYFSGPDLYGSSKRGLGNARHRQTCGHPACTPGSVSEPGCDSVHARGPISL